MKIYKTDKIITREKVRANPDVLYLFGDNDIRKGLGGQAKEMRGEPNAMGISTKKLPSNKPDAFKTDDEYSQNCLTILEDVHRIKMRILENNYTNPYKALVIPPIGMGLANLPKNAPKTYHFLQILYKVYAT